MAATPYRYVSRQEIIARQGDTFVTSQSDRDLDGSGDLDAIAAAVVDAEAECDSYIATKYTLPLTGVTGPDNAPTALKRIVMDIAIYRLAREHDVLTEETTNRYNAAVRWLELVAKGTVTLVDVGTVNVPLVGGLAYIDSGERLMSRRKLRGLY